MWFTKNFFFTSQLRKAFVDILIYVYIFLTKFDVNFSKIPVYDVKTRAYRRPNIPVFFENVIFVISDLEKPLAEILSQVWLMRLWKKRSHNFMITYFFEVIWIAFLTHWLSEWSSWRYALLRFTKFWYFQGLRRRRTWPRYENHPPFNSRYRRKGTRIYENVNDHRFTITLGKEYRLSQQQKSLLYWENEISLDKENEFESNMVLRVG